MTSITKQEVRTDTAPAPRPFYSQGVIAGDMVYVSGSLGIDPATGKMVERTIADRTAQILKNIKEILNAAGSSLENVINIFITDMQVFATMNKAYMKVFDSGVYPVRTCVAVKELPQGTDVEMEATAHL